MSDVLRTPKWWFKRREAAPQEPAAPVAPSSVVEPEIESSAPAARAPGVDLKLDPDRNRITFQISYTSAIVSAFTVLVIVGLAYVIGSRINQGPAAAVAGPSTEEIRSRPARPAVLDVRSGSTAQPPTTVDAEDAVVAAPAAAPSQQAPAPTEASGQRIIGRNYVVVQIYPDEKSANEARDLLNKNGIPCTIEQGLREYATKNWFCVVGLTGFDRIGNNKDYDRYTSAIVSLSQRFLKDSKFKQFQPIAYKWRG